MRWYCSTACPAFGDTEEDGLGSGPPELRDRMLASNGTWLVRVDGTERAKAIQAARRAPFLQGIEASTLLRSLPLLPAGTNVEAEWLAKLLADEGIPSEVQAPDGGGRPLV